ncbi:MBL fold metallo-hydrolase [Cohnella suwonensis]|uniref:MBL fold metallo-hydrolase n=1 Tax=Cohnella suwonensis TaxID=696072 RepID=A0ABW0LQQ8_9BACL
MFPDRPILAAIVGSKRTLLMDAGNSPAHAMLFREGLAKQGVRPPDLLVLTHWHWDHSFGMSEWGIPSIAHTETAQALRKLKGLDGSDDTLESLVKKEIISDSSVAHIKLEYGADRRIQVIEPDIVFESRLSIDLGGVVCDIEHVGGDHAEDSCLLYVREDRTLFLGDALGPSVYGGPRSYTSANFLRLIRRMYEYDAEIYVESHGEPVDKEAFRLDIRDWEHLARLVERFGSDREQIAREMAAYLRATALPLDFVQAIEWFMVGLELRDPIR